MPDLPRLAELLRARNTVESNIANLLQCEVDLNIVGEQIAASIFGIRFVPATAPGQSAGVFTCPTLAGKTVEVRWYLRREGILNIHTDPAPDYTLVLAGPKFDPSEARALVDPWIITSAYLFHMPELFNMLRTRGVRIGPRISVNSHLWEQAEIFPSSPNSALVLTNEQLRLLQLFG